MKLSFISRKEEEIVMVVDQHTNTSDKYLCKTVGSIPPMYQADMGTILYVRLN